MENNKALRKRELILNGSMLKVVLMIALPLVFYNLCNYMYGIFDMMIVQKEKIGDAADIVVLDQIKNMISTLGGAVATGGGIIIARKYGEGDIKLAKRFANTLFSLALIVAGITLLFIPFGVPLLKILKTDQSTIDNAMGYYNVQMCVLAITTMNNVYISIEKSKGNTLLLFILNIMVIVIKISLTLIFVYTGLRRYVNMTWIAAATLIAQLSIFSFGMVSLFLPKNILQIRIKELNLDGKKVLNIIKIAFPVFVGRFLFSFGKVFVNSKATVVYGKQCVGALGISNTIAGSVQNVINSFEDAGATIVSQNLGNNNGKRIKSLFIINLIYLLIIACFGLILLIVFQNQIARFFAPDDLEYQQMILNIVKYERVDLLFVAFTGASQSIFYGFGKTRITMGLSMATLFVFRIPALLIMMYPMHLNYEACGIAMFLSNSITGVIALIWSLIFLKGLKNNKKYQNLVF